MKKVSVVIITYNRPIEILFRAVNSVLRQDYSCLELFVVNDAPDNQPLSQKIQNEINKLNDKRVKYLSYSINHGSNYARNYGLNHCTGEYVAFLDDDDEWYHNKLTMQVAEIEKNPQIGLVSCAFDISDGNRIVNYKKANPEYDNTIDQLLKSNYVGGSSFPLIRKNAIDIVGGFDEDMKSCQEYELWIRIREVSLFSTVPHSLGIYYNSPDSTYKGNANKYYSGDKKIIEKHKKLLNEHKKAFNSHLNGMAIQWLIRKKINWYLEYKIKAFCVKPLSLDNFSIVHLLARKTRRGK